MSLSDDQIQECFAIFDKDNDGKISIEDLGPALKSLGKSPFNSEIQAIKEELNVMVIDLKTFKTVCRRPFKSPTETQKRC